MGYSYSWKPGEHPQLTKDGVTIECYSENYVPLVAVTREQGAPAREEESHDVGSNSRLIGYSPSQEESSICDGRAHLIALKQKHIEII